MRAISLLSLQFKMRTVRDASKKANDGKGRPTKKVEPVVTALLRTIETGLPYTLCCRLVGISYDSFMTWKREDPAFNQEVEAAAAKAAARLLAKIERQARNNFAAAAWILERRFPELFSRPEVQLNLSNTTNHNAHVITISLEEAERIEAESAPIREAARQMLEEYQRNRNSSHSVEASAEIVDAGQSGREPTIPEKARARLDQYLRDRR
jgi:hypothetical protein